MTSITRPFLIVKVLVRNISIFPWCVENSFFKKFIVGHPHGKMIYQKATWKLIIWLTPTEKIADVFFKKTFEKKKRELRHENSMQSKTMMQQFWFKKFLLNRNRTSEEWPGGLRRCNQNRKVSGSNPIRPSAGLRDPTSLRCSRQPSGQISKNAVISIGWNEAALLIKIQIWPEGSQIAGFL